MTPRGVRLCNPGNIRHGSDWRGLAPEQPDPAFCSFVHPVYGIRALVKVLLAYQRRHGLNTIRGIIHRWAPTNENDTDAYVRSVSKRMNVPPDTVIKVDDVVTAQMLATAIIEHENGQNPYSVQTIRDGAVLAIYG